MVHKRLKLLSILLLTGFSAAAQEHHAGIGGAVFAVRTANTANRINGLYEKTNRLEGNMLAVTYHLSGNNVSFDIGVGSSKIMFEKETQGVFAQTNQFGLATVSGRIDYWSFPLSLSFLMPTSLPRTYRYRRLHSYIRISYVPSFEAGNSYRIKTSGGAELSSFQTDYQLNAQGFQHSLQLGFSNRFYARDKKIILSIDPFAAIGSGYFKESGTRFKTFSYGLNLSIAFKFRVPVITIERETHNPDKEEKRKQLEQKQKEIEDQLNKQPK